jgi:hypothetical protein
MAAALHMARARGGDAAVHRYAHAGPGSAGRGAALLPGDVNCCLRSRTVSLDDGITDLLHVLTEVTSP